MLFSQSHHGGGRSAARAAGGLSPSSWGRPRCRRPSLRPTRTTGKRAQGYVDMSAQPPTLNKPHQPRHRHRGMTLTEFCFLCHLFWGSVSGLWYNPLHKFPAAIHLCDEGAATESEAPGFSRLRPFCQAPNCWDFQAAKCQLTTCNNNTLTVYLPGLQMA